MSSSKKSGKSDSELRSLPWNKDEYLSIDGIDRIYTAMVIGGQPTIIDVLLPGCKKIPFKALAEQGYDVIMPKRIRTERFG